MTTPSLSAPLSSPLPAPLPAPIRFGQAPQRILLILPKWVGDVVMATPFVRAVFARFPDAEIKLLMKRSMRGVLEDSPWAKDAFFLDDDKKALVQRLRAESFDLAIIMPNSFSSAWLAFRAGATRRVGFNRDGRGLLLTDRLSPPNKIRGGFQPMPLVEYYTYLAAFLGCETPGDDLTLFTNSAETEQVQSRLPQEDKAIVVLCPGANFGASKCWMPERFAAVADRLVRAYEVTIAISPGPGEEPLARAIQDAMQEPSVLLVDPCLTLGELKSLIRMSVLLLGNDTGPRHFARAFDVPRVTVFGPTEVRWTDTSHAHETIVRVDVPCGPCHEKVCPLDFQECMERVTVDMVTDACREQLQEVVRLP